MKKTISVLLALLMVLSLLPTTAWAAVTGCCGENATFSLDDDGTVTISGTGWVDGEDDDYFEVKTEFKRANVQNGITALSYGSFAQCEMLEEVILPDSITSMYDETFSGCTALKSVRMPNNPNMIMGSKVFYDCSNLTSIVIPTKYLNSYSFYGCSNLKSVAFTSNFTGAIQRYSFYGCSNLPRIDIPKGTTYLGEYTFVNCENLSSLTIPNSLWGIGQNAFWGCSSLDDLVIPGTVRNIEDGAFGYCTALTSLKLGDGLQSIGEDAFICCISLTDVTIPASVTHIGGGAFASCSSLQDIQVAAGNKDYTSVDGVLFTKSMDRLVCFPGGRGGDYTVSDGVSIIGGNAFGQNSRLTSITIPTSVTRIGDYAFTNCLNLKNIYYQGTVKQWKDIEIGDENEYLSSAVIHYGAGDLNGGGLDISDVEALYEHLTGTASLSTGGLALADINGDGNVDVYDLQYLYECVAGI